MELLDRQGEGQQCFYFHYDFFLKEEEQMKKVYIRGGWTVLKEGQSEWSRQVQPVHVGVFSPQTAFPSMSEE